MDVGSANPTLNRSHVHPIEILWPPVSEQRAIASVLGTLDDKIEQNRRTSAALERLARAIFRAWFVDFEPVKAKAAGAKSFAGMPEATFDLLPDGLVSSELGLIPRGWRSVAVSDLVVGIYDGPHATPPESSDGPVFLGIKNLTGTRIDLTEIRRMSETDWPRWTKRVVPRAEDIVFTYEATIGYFALIPPGLRCCLGRRMALMRPNDEASARYLFHYAVSDRFQRLLAERTVHGSTVNRTSLTEFPNYPVLTPPPPVIEAFDTIASPIWAAIHAGEAESAKLAEVRDYLLPRLLSGRVRVREAVQQAEALT